MAESHLTLSVLPDLFAICKLDRNATIPDWATQGSFFSITRNEDELSIVCRESDAPEETERNRGWRCFKVEGPLDFSLTGIMASLAAPLGEAGISIFAVATFETDYLLVKESDLDKSIRALTEAGHSIAPSDPCPLTTVS